MVRQAHHERILPKILSNRKVAQSLSLSIVMLGKDTIGRVTLMKIIFLFLFFVPGFINAAQLSPFTLLYKDPNVLRVSAELTNINGLQATLLNAHAKNDQTSENAILQKILTGYQNILSTYKQAYQSIHIPIDVRIPGPFLQILMNYQKTVLQSIRWAIARIRHQKPNTPTYSADVQTFLNQLSSFDARVLTVAQSIYGSQASFALNYYYAQRGAITQPFFINTLNNIARSYAKAPSLTLAQNIYKQAQQYWSATIKVPGYPRRTCSEKNLHKPWRRFGKLRCYSQL